MSLDCGNGVRVVDKKIGGIGSGMVVKALQNSMTVDEGRKASFDALLRECKKLVGLLPRESPQCSSKVWYQRSSELRIRKLPFQKLVRETS
uniref:Uncharacterized protein n=1 Tax=Quercus lobata TaxID=97700 RepID=A0A7N2MJZ5_QUELO